MTEAEWATAVVARRLVAHLTRRRSVPRSCDVEDEEPRGTSNAQASGVSGPSPDPMFGKRGGPRRVQTPFVLPARGAGAFCTYLFVPRKTGKERPHGIAPVPSGQQCITQEGDEVPDGQLESWRRRRREIPVNSEKKRDVQQI